MTVFITFGDIVGMIIGALVGLLLLFIWASIAWRQWRCKHDGDFGETQACDAICNACGKNLGFIGKVREARAAATNTKETP